MRKTLSVLLAAVMTAGAFLAGCSNQTTSTTVEATTTETTVSPGTATKSEAETTTAEQTNISDPAAPIRIGSLKGPTSMGLVKLMDDNENGNAACSYEFTMVTAADELIGKMANGELDIALIPANVASVLYHKMESSSQSGISVIDINTLGVLDIVAADDTIKSIADLKGRTLVLTGKGTTPDYVIHYLLQANGLSQDDVKLEFKSEAAEVAAVLKEQSDTVGLLPQPFATAACAQNENLKIVLDLTEEWQKVQGEDGSSLVTGVTVVQNKFLEERGDDIATFLEEHAASAEFANTDLDAASELIAAAGIIEKAPVAKKALPYCNITCLTGEEMKQALSGYLQVLFEQDPKSIGGKLPEDTFYYIP